MDSIMDFLKMAVVTIVLVAAISYAMNYVNSGQELAANTTGNLEDNISSAAMLVYKMYDDKEVSTQFLYDAINSFSGGQHRLEFQIQTCAMQDAQSAGDGVCKGYPDNSASKSFTSEVRLSYGICEYYQYPVFFDGFGEECDVLADRTGESSYSTCSSNKEFFSYGHKLTFKQWNDSKLPDSPLYISPEAKWHSELVRNASGEIEAIRFKQVRENV